MVEMHAVFLSWKSGEKKSSFHAYSWLITCSFWCEKMVEMHVVFLSWKSGKKFRFACLFLVDNMQFLV